MRHKREKVIPTENKGGKRLMTASSQQCRVTLHEGPVLLLVLTSNMAARPWLRKKLTASSQGTSSSLIKPTMQTHMEAWCYMADISFREWMHWTLCRCFHKMSHRTLQQTPWQAPKVVLLFAMLCSWWQIFTLWAKHPMQTLTASTLNCLLAQDEFPAYDLLRMYFTSYIWP